ncbi:MAG: hypothetical protein ABW328_09140 [Ilumatobacteraceae bacterium]
MSPPPSAVPFQTPIRLEGPWREPVQMLQEQSYDGHGSVHDGENAAALGLAGAPIEGPTHFSQFDPLAFDRWGIRWFEHGCISSHFRTMVVEGEQVRASITVTPAGGPDAATIEAHKPDGTPVLEGSMSVGPDHPPTALARRRAGQPPPGALFIIDQLEVGLRIVDDEASAITFGDRNGSLYPFSLAEKVERITEPHPWYTPDGSASSPWGRPIVPFEMLSVLTNKGRAFPVRGPALGLFLDLEVRMLDGPVFVDQPYVVHREVIGLGQSRRTESYWTESILVEEGTGRQVAVVVLHQGVFKDSYAGYPGQDPGVTTSERMP